MPRESLSRSGLNRSGLNRSVLNRPALILIDVINHFEFPDAEAVLRHALPVAPNIARLKERAKKKKVPVIYVNDNFGQWRSVSVELIRYCTRPEAAGREFVRQIEPDKDDYFVLKPMHSAFYQSPLESLLKYLNVSTLIICGLTTNSCIVCTAHDANMREFELIVPRDCCAARSATEHRQALDLLDASANARIVLSTSIRF